MKKKQKTCEALECENIVTRTNALYCSKDCRHFDNGRYIGETREEYNERKAQKALQK